MSDGPWEQAKLPNILYCCDVDGCYEVQTFPADMLRWVSLPSRSGWFCEECEDSFVSDHISEGGSGDDVVLGPTLEQEMIRRGLEDD